MADDRFKVQNFGALLIDLANAGPQTDRVVRHLLRLDVNDTWRWAVEHPDALRHDQVAA